MRGGQSATGVLKRQLRGNVRERLIWWVVGCSVEIGLALDAKKPVY